MIANRVMEYLDGPGHEIDLDQVAIATGHIATSMKRNLGSERDDGKRKVRLPRPSGTFACPRQMIFNAMGLETEGYGWRSRLTFTHGDMTEAMGVLLYRQAMAARGESETIVSPCVKTGEQLELDVILNPPDWGIEREEGIHLRGHVDMTIRGHNGQEHPVDWKSASRYGFQNANEGAKDKGHKWWEKEELGYIAQVRLYMMMMRTAGRSDGAHGYLVFVCKDTGHLCEVLIERDEQAERKLIEILLWANTNIDHAHEQRARVLEQCQVEELNESAGDEATDAVLEDWVRKNIPRAKWATDSVIKRTGSVARPDGTKGECLELNTNGITIGKERIPANPNGWRCSYCPHTARCWPEFALIPLAKPVWRTNG